MHLMLTNKGPTPLPIGTGQQGGFEGLLPPGLEIPLALEEVTTLVFGEQPAAQGRSKLKALKDVDPDSPLAKEYATDIDQWKGRSDPTAETAEMKVVLFVRNVGFNDVTITTTEGPVTVKGGDGVLIETMSGTVSEGEAGAGTPPNSGGGGGGTTSGTVTGFTATLDPTVTISGTPIKNGDTVVLTATGGDSAAQAKINGHSGTLYNVSGTSAQISNLDLTGMNVEGLTANAAVTTAPDTTGTITSFTAANPTEVTMDAQDAGMISVGGTITLEAKAGSPDAMALINGQTVQVLSTAPVTLQLDLTAADVVGLTADFTINAAAPPAPAPAPAPASFTIQITAFGASNPGLAGVAQSDGLKVHVGDTLTLTQTGGAQPGTIPAGQQTSVTAIDSGSTTLTLSMDTSTYNVDGLTASAVVTPGATGAPAPAPAPQAPVSPPPWTIRNITQINPVVGTVDDITGLAQGDYLTFTVIEGTQAQKDALNGQGGQVQSINGMTVQIGYNGSAAGDPTGIVLQGAK